MDDANDEALIASFTSHKKVVSGSLTSHRLDSYRKTLNLFRRYLPADKSFTEINKDELYAAIGALKDRKSPRTGEPLAANTLSTYIIIIRDFFRYLVAEGKNTTLKGKDIDTIKPPRPNIVTKTENNVYDADDMKVILSSIKGNQATRNRAIVGTLYDLGCRPSELTRLKWTDCKRDDYGWEIIIRDTKTNKARVGYVTSYTALLDKWKNDSPYYDVHGPVFTKYNSGEPLNLKGLQMILSGINSKVGEQLGGKKVFAYNFRTSHVTNSMRDGVPLSAIVDTHWNNPSTKMISTYSRFSQKDTRKAFLENAGITPPDPMKSSPSNIKCPKCAYELNAPDARICLNCGTPLMEEEKALQEEREDREFKIRYHKMRITEYEAYIEEQRADGIEFRSIIDNLKKAIAAEKDEKKRSDLESDLISAEAWLESIPNAIEDLERYIEREQQVIGSLQSF